MRLFTALTITLSSFLLSCGNLTRSISSAHASYDYVGAIKFGSPEPVGDDSYEVAMNFTGGEWSINSAICFHRADARVVNDRINIKVFTSLCDGGSPSRYFFRIDQASAEEYDVVYEDKDGTLHPVSNLRLKN